MAAWENAKQLCSEWSQNQSSSVTISPALFIWKQKPAFVSPSTAPDAQLHPSQILGFLKWKISSPQQFQDVRRNLLDPSALWGQAPAAERESTKLVWIIKISGLEPTGRSENVKSSGRSPRFQSNRLGLSSSSDDISQSRITTSHFKKRTLWYSYTNEWMPYAFLLWSTHLLPRHRIQGGNATSDLDRLNGKSQRLSVTVWSKICLPPWSSPINNRLQNRVIKKFLGNFLVIATSSLANQISGLERSHRSMSNCSSSCSATVMSGSYHAPVSSLFCCRCLYNFLCALWIKKGSQCSLLLS